MPGKFQEGRGGGLEEFVVAGLFCYQVSPPLDAC